MYRSDYSLACSDQPSAPPFYPGSYLRVIPPPSSSFSEPNLRARNLAMNPSLNTTSSSFSSATYLSSLKSSAHPVIRPGPLSLQPQTHVPDMSTRLTGLRQACSTSPAVMRCQFERDTQCLPWTVNLGDDSEVSHSTDVRKRTARHASNSIPLTSAGSLDSTKSSKNVDMVFGSRAGRPIRRVSSVPITLLDRYILADEPNTAPPPSPSPKYSIIPAPSLTGESVTYSLSLQSSTLPYMLMDGSESSCSDDESCLSVSPFPTTPLCPTGNNSLHLYSSSSAHSVSSTSICSHGAGDEDHKDMFDLMVEEQDIGLNRSVETFYGTDNSSMNSWQAEHVMLLPPVSFKPQKRIRKYTFGILS